MLPNFERSLDEIVQGLDKTQTPFIFAQNRLASRYSFAKQINVYLHKFFNGAMHRK